ncbi:hypothetical protein [Parasedimentitalea maritima]|uniref:Capsular polysaccharide transport system permease protein n=1 Tax=Parasedimentitalea maritima TaxID=2578117 RepID=A0A6A4RIN7_9RHOB|nr:hypothetical protein [Zongyanglinia marina]KAE9629291.1 hypothetical protein GP644_12805 [Zongyanglinia marina]
MTSLAPADQISDPAAPLLETNSWRGRFNRTRRLTPFYVLSRLTFVFGLLLPAIVGGYYYYALASDQYETETRLVVRTIGLQTSADDGPGRVTTLGGAAVVQDAHILVNYLKSLDITRDLESEVDLRALFSGDQIDRFSRLDPQASMETLHSYWQDHTIAYVDGPSGIIQFSVRAFTPQDAVQISQAAIDLAATLIENLAEQAKRDLLARAERELDSSLEAYVASLDALRNLQNDAGILDPQAEAGVSTVLISNLILEQLKAEAALNALQASNVVTSPQITLLQNQIETLNEQIAAQRRQVAGLEEKSGALTAFFAKINALETERFLAESLFRSASRNFDVAKSSAQRQSTFVSVFAPPILPSKPSHPRRLASWALLVGCCVAAWATFLLIWAAINDHRR